MPQQDRDEVAQLTALAGLAVPEARLAALTAGLALAKGIAAALAAVAYGETEPASRFQPPAPDR